MNTNKIYLKKARRIAHFLSLLPYIKMIGLTGSVAQNKATEKSDIDFFIIVKSGRIWMGRFLIVLVLKLIGQYRSDQKIAGKICPNCYQAEDALLIHPCDLATAQEYAHFLPLFDQGGMYRKFIKTNSWIGGFGQKFEFRTAVIKKGPIFPFARRIIELILKGQFGNYSERKLKEYQTRRILLDSRTYQLKSRVIVSDQMLYFHPAKN